jgi:hypothetical protein
LTLLSEFEARLAEVLGSRLPAPFAGRVSVAPGTGPANQPAVILGVQQAEPVEPDIGSRRPEIVPGSGDFRRVLRLACTVGLEVRPATNQGRTQQMQGLDALLYTLDEPDLRDGTALAGAADPGFFIQRMRLTAHQAPFLAEDETLARLTLCAEGWFWPVGQAGETGIAIGEVRIRGVRLPLEALMAATPAAGGPAVELTLRLTPAGTLRVTGPAGSPPGPPLPFGSLAVALFGPGMRPAAGSLDGVTPGADGVGLVTLSEGAATLAYVPPAEPAVDELVVALEDGAGGLGVELGRLLIDVREA